MELDVGKVESDSGIPWCLRGKEFTFNAVYPVSIPGSGRSPGGGNDYPLQCSYLENSMDRAAWKATVFGVAKSQKPMKQLTHIHI